MEWLVKNTKVKLLTVEQYDNLPNGTLLLSIFGEPKIKMTTSNTQGDPYYIDMDTRQGFIAYGFYIEKSLGEC